jgi:hypothetical protein
LSGPLQQQNSSQPIPHDILGLTGYGYFLENWVFILFVSLLALVIGYYLFKIFYKKRSKDPVVVCPYKEAIKALKEVAPVKPYDRKAQEHFYYELSHFLRLVIEISKGFRATDLTFKELRKPLLKKFENNQELSLKLLGFLEKSELIKFAEKESSEEKSLEDKSKVIEWALSLEKKETEGSRYLDSLEKRES